MLRRKRSKKIFPAVMLLLMCVLTLGTMVAVAESETKNTCTVDNSKTIFNLSNSVDSYGIILEKNVVGEIPDAEKEKVYTIILEGMAEESKGTTHHSDLLVFPVEVKNGEQKQIQAPQTDHKVILSKISEEPADIPDYELKTQYEYEWIEEKSNRLKIGEPYQIDVTHDMERLVIENFSSQYSYVCTISDWNTGQEIKKEEINNSERAEINVKEIADNTSEEAATKIKIELRCDAASETGKECKVTLFYAGPGKGSQEINEQVKGGRLLHIIVTNTYIKETGDLTVEKAVVSTDKEDEKKEWNFTVTLVNAPITGQYGAMTFENGKANLVLMHDGSATATGLPVGVKYIVEEEDADGFVTTSEGETGTIKKDDPAIVKFTNTRKDEPEQETDSLTVKKIVSGSQGDKTKEWHFTVTLTDKSINGKYGDMEFKDGVSTFTLKHDQSRKATGLPAGIGYTVKEAEEGQDGYTTTIEGPWKREDERPASQSERKASSSDTRPSSGQSTPSTADRPSKDDHDPDDDGDKTASLSNAVRSHRAALQSPVPSKAASWIVGRGTPFDAEKEEEEGGSTIRDGASSSAALLMEKAQGPRGSSAMVTFTNSKGEEPEDPKDPTGRLTVKKEWSDGRRHEGVTVHLLQVKDGAEKEYGTAVVLDESNNWSHTWEELPVKDQDGSAYRYRVREEVPSGYRVSYENNGGVTLEPGEGSTETITVRNTKTPPPGGGGDDDDDDDDHPGTTPPSETPPSSEPPTDPTSPTDESTEPPTPTLPDPNDPDSPDTITITDGDVPRTYRKVWNPEKQEFEYILDEGVPLDFMLPKTGDSSRGILWAVLWTVSLIGLYTVYQTRPGKKDQ